MKIRDLLFLLPLLVTGCSLWRSSDDAQNLVVLEHNVGGINATTNFNRVEIETLLDKNYQLNEGIQERRGKTISYYTVVNRKDKNKQAIMTIYGQLDEKVEEIVIEAKGVNSRDAYIGMQFKQLYNQAYGFCRHAETTEDYGNIVCNDAFSEQISYIFSGQPNDFGSLLPPDDVLSGWTLTKIIWSSK